LFCAFRGWRGRWGCWGAPFWGVCLAVSATVGDTSSLLAYGDVFASYCCYYGAWSKLHRVGVAASSASRCRECRSPHRCGGQPARPGGVSRRVERHREAVTDLLPRFQRGPLLPVQGHERGHALVELPLLAAHRLAGHLLHALVGDALRRACPTELGRSHHPGLSGFVEQAGHQFGRTRAGYCALAGGQEPPVAPAR